MPREKEWQEPKPKVYPAGRECKECGKPLSIYNGEKVCCRCASKLYAKSSAKKILGKQMNK